MKKAIALLALLCSSALASKCSIKCWHQAIGSPECNTSGCQCGSYEDCVAQCHGKAPSRSCEAMFELEQVFTLADESTTVDSSRRDLRRRKRDAAALPDASMLEERAPVAIKKSSGWVNHCGVPGSICKDKREADAEPDADIVEERAAVADARKKPITSGWVNHCGVPGSICKDKRDADAQPVTQPDAAVLEERAALADARKKPITSGWVNHCGVPGSICKDKRDADAQPDTQPDGAVLEERAPLADARKPITSGWVNHCGVPGSIC